MSFTAKLPWWIKGSKIQALKNIAESLFVWMAGKPETVIAQAFVGITTEKGLDIRWSEMPFKPSITPQDKRNFIRYYKGYLKVHGTRAGIMLVQDIFELDYFELVNLNDIAVGTDVYPHHAIRIRGSWSPDQKLRVRELLHIVLPARCLFHLQLIDLVEGRGFGRTAFGTKFGR